MIFHNITLIIRYTRVQSLPCLLLNKHFQVRRVIFKLSTMLSILKVWRGGGGVEVESL